MKTACKKPKHILQLSLQEKKAFLESFDHIFSDIDGVLIIAGNHIAGASEGYQALKQIGKSLKFITNNNMPRDQFVQLFAKVNLSVEENDIQNVTTIISYLRSIQYDGLSYVMATQNFKNSLRNEGFRVIDGPSEIFKIEKSMVIEPLLHDGQKVDAVFVDVDHNLNLGKIDKALEYLRQNPECLFIAGATDEKIPGGRRGATMLGPGLFIKLIEQQCQQKLKILGKPGKDLSRSLVTRFGLESDPQRGLMVGDMLPQDIGFGKQSGFQTLLVLSGVCTLEEMQTQTNEDYIPDYYANGVGDFVELVREVYNN